MVDSKEAKKHYAWRKRVKKNLPALAERVFALRKKFYAGCGFHYELEKNLGKVIAMMNDFGTILTIEREILEECLVGELNRSVKEAENSAKQLDKGKEKE